MKNKTIIVIIIVLVVVCLCFAVVGGAAAYYLYTTTQPAVSAGEAFLDAVKNDRYQEAFSLMTPNAKKDIGNPHELKRIITESDLIPGKWSVVSRSVTDKDGTMGGKMTTSVGSEFDYVIELQQINRKWLVNYYGHSD